MTKSQMLALNNKGSINENTEFHIPGSKPFKYNPNGDKADKNAQSTYET